jgi:hypothetical protein
MKNWIMIVTMKKKKEDKDNNGMQFFVLTSDGE